MNFFSSNGSEKQKQYSMFWYIYRTLTVLFGAVQIENVQKLGISEREKNVLRHVPVLRHKDEEREFIVLLLIQRINM